MSNKKYSEFDQLQRSDTKILKKENPELFLPEFIFDEEAALKEIGIELEFADREEGYIRYYPFDFIVEEIQKDGRLSMIEPRGHYLTEPRSENFTLYADLVKVCLSSTDALIRLAEKLKIDASLISYAGMKDTLALTSQRIGIKGIKMEEIKDIDFNGFFLTNLFYGKGKIYLGDLWGNRFTIFIRTKKQLNEKWLADKLGNISQSGVLNYYHFQRFGGIRLKTHNLGKLVLRGDYEGSVKLALIGESRYEIKIAKILREKAKESWGRWQEMKKIYSLLPFVFRNEIKILDYLIEKPDDFLNVLKNNKEQTMLWLSAYSSLLFNKYLSRLAGEKSGMPEKIPLVFSDDMDDRAVYEKWLVEDGIQYLAKRLEPFNFMRLKKRLVSAKIFPYDIKYFSNKDGVAISFSLPKGAYATTFLMNLFKLREGLPVPEWVKTEEYDIKKILGVGTIKPARMFLKKYAVSILDYL